MSALAKALVAGRHQRLIYLVLLAGIFSVLLVIGYGFVNWQVASLVAQDQRAEIARTDTIRHSVNKALQLMQRDATSPPCSHAFLAQMQHIAFLADGLNEFLYAPSGYVSCSTSRASFTERVFLGEEDVPPSGPERISWRIQRNLGPIGLTDAVGTIAQIGDFAVAIPPYGSENEVGWLSRELVARSGDRVWTIAGTENLYKELISKKPETWMRRLTTVSSIACDSQGLHCVASRADLIGWARSSITILSSTVVLTAMFAWICAFTIVRWLRDYWSFEARFLRRLDTQSVLVLYQPIVDISSDEVACVEALARWVDVDGTVVSPANFIDIVVKAKRTAEFTQMVADRAFADLNEHPPPCSHPLEVNFNVFACDFDSGRLLKIFAQFLNQPHRFRVAIELIEFHDIDLEKAQATVEALAAAGVKTYIDDFGTGYSSIERVARLPVDGVKLDRSFAMSPPDSIMGRMLVQVIEMVKTTGRSIIVEGVETLTRLNLLRATGIVGYVQGYVIAPPLEIEALRAFMLRGNAAWKADDVAA